MTGRVKWFNNDKGYGFIDFKQNEDIFVHYSAIELDGYKTLNEGQLVEFKLIETSKGYQAINVKLLKFSVFKSFKKSQFRMACPSDVLHIASLNSIIISS